jgi:hypothetical protein
MGLFLFGGDVAAGRDGGAAIGKGAGWVTRAFSSMRTVSLPWLTAAGDRRTALLMTTVPVRLLTITLAAVRQGDVDHLDRGHERRRVSAPSGRRSATVTASSDWPCRDSAG